MRRDDFKLATGEARKMRSRGVLKRRLGTRPTVIVQSAILAREYETSPTGDNLIGVFSSVTPLTDLNDGSWSQTNCYAYMKLFGVVEGDVIELRLIDSAPEHVATFHCLLRGGFAVGPTPLPFTLVASIAIPHRIYGLHRLAIVHEGAEVGEIRFDVKPMPNPFG